MCVCACNASECVSRPAARGGGGGEGTVVYLQLLEEVAAIESGHLEAILALTLEHPLEGLLLRVDAQREIARLHSIAQRPSGKLSSTRVGGSPGKAG